MSDLSAIYVVPNSLRGAIYAKLDAVIGADEEIKKERELLYADLLAYFNEHGCIPEFTLAKRERP